MNQIDIEIQYKEANEKLHNLLDKYLTSEISLDELKEEVRQIMIHLPAYYYDEDYETWKPSNDLDEDFWSDEFEDIFRGMGRFCHNGSNSFIAYIIPDHIRTIN